MRWSYLICAMLLWGTTLANAAEPVAAAPKTDEELRAQLLQLMEKHHAPAVSYAVFDANGVRFTDSIGIKNTTTREAVDERTLFQIGSITKTVTAIAILQLVEQGQFALTTPVKSVLPEAPIFNPFEDVAPVTIGHLLSHTAGFDDMHFKAFLTPTEQRGGHLQISLAHPEPYRVRWQPGRYHSYSNPSYVLLGAILEAHYQQPWDTLIERQVLKPLGMDNVLALTSEARRGNFATAHRGDEMTPVGVKYQLAQADGALWSSARQLAELGRFVMTDGRSHPGILQPETVQLMKQPFAGVAVDAQLPWGYGLGVYSRDVDGRLMVGHTGGVIGALASVSWLADGSAGYVVLTNTDNVLRALEKPIARYLQSLPATHANEPLTVPLDKIDGWFRSTNPRNAIFHLPEYLFNVAHLSATTDHISMKAVVPGTGEVTWLPRGKNRLADVDSPAITNAALVRNASGDVVGLLLDNSYLTRVSAFSAIAPVASVLLSVLLLITVPFGRRRALHNPWLRRLPTVALLLLVLGVVAALQFDLETVMAMNWQTVTVWLVTTLLPVLALMGVGLSLWTWRHEVAMLAKWRCLLGSMAAAVISGWFAAFHWFSLALWAW